MLWPDNLILFFWRGLHSAYMGCVPAYWSADPSRPIRRRRDERGYYIKRIFIYQVDRYRLQGPVIMLRRAFSLFLFLFFNENRLWCYCTFQTNSKKEIYTSLKRLLDVNRLDYYLGRRRLSVFFVLTSVRCDNDQLKVPAARLLSFSFNVLGSSVLAFKVTVQVKETLIGPTSNSGP